MRINEHTAISGDNVLLVPYSGHHVETYHEWMQDEALRIATASEPLTLPEEYAMQASWRTDTDKLTFIICLPCSFSPSTSSLTLPSSADVPESMLGDVNIFLVDADEDEQPSFPSSPDDTMCTTTAADEQDLPLPRTVVAEVELMIASPSARRKGNGRAALGLFLGYLRAHVDDILHEYAGGSSGGAAATAEREVQLGYLRVRIGQDNGPSLALFESLGFRRVGNGPNYFGEVELRRNLEWMGDEGPRGVEMVYVPRETGAMQGV